MALRRTIVDQFAGTPNFLHTIAAHPCAVSPILYLESMSVATLFLLIRLFTVDLNDLIRARVKGTTIAVADAADRGTKRRRGRLPMGGRIPPNAVAKGNRFLWILPDAVETIGFTWLAANFVNDFAYTWTSIIARCDACTEASSPAAQGPLTRTITPGQSFLGEPWEGIPFPNVLQNRAGWTSTLESVGLPPGDFHVIVMMKFQQIQIGTVTLRGRIRVTTTFQGIPFTYTADEQELTVPEDTVTDLLLHAVVPVPAFASANVQWQWGIDNAQLPIVERIEGRVVVMGQNSCST